MTDDSYWRTLVTSMQLELHQKDAENAMLRAALKFYAGLATDAWWEGNRLLAVDKFGCFCEEIAGPYVALQALGMMTQLKSCPSGPKER